METLMNDEPKRQHREQTQISMHRNKKNFMKHQLFYDRVKEINGQTEGSKGKGKEIVTETSIFNESCNSSG
uniref:Uncharacterized protein n=1 Tax=Rhizophagus irregularis (strain DAOM 181602 / DAOM 197198 / MUCL 43194) TaxID=747089 RepID=U9UL98_RHIID